MLHSCRIVANVTSLRAQRAACRLLLASVAVLALPLRLTAQSCTYGEWSAPKRLSDGAIRYASLARLGRRTYVVGNNLSRFDMTPSAETFFAGMILGGRRIPAPVHEQPMWYPRLASLGDTSLMMIWGETDSLATKRERESPPRLRWIRAAVLHAGKWGPAQDVLRGDSLGWRDHETSGPLVSREGVLHVALAGRRSLTYLRFREGSWTTTTISGARGAAYVSGALGPEPHAVSIAFVDAYQDTSAAGGHDENSIFLVRSRDDGDTWDAPRLVVRSGRVGAYDAQLHVAQDMRLVWLKSERAFAIPWRLTTSVSRDSGRTWTQGPEIQLPDWATNPGSAVDTCGGLHVIYDDWHGGGDKGHIDYVRFAHDAWTPIQHLLADHALLGGSLSPVIPGGMTLVFLMRPEPARADGTLLTRYSRLPMRVWRRPD